MSVITLSSVLGGVSKQPEPVRLDSQFDDMINLVPDVSRGLTKRASIDELLGISTGINEDDFIEFFEDSDGTNYMMAVRNTISGGEPIRIWNLNENAETTVTADANAKAYFVLQAGDTPRDNFKSATSGDTTILVNNTFDVTLAATTGDDTNIYAGFFVKVAEANATYSLQVEWISTANPGGISVTASIVSPASTSATRGPFNIASALKVAFDTTNVDAEMTVSVVDGILMFYLNSAFAGKKILRTQVEDPVGGGLGFSTYLGKTREFSDLPTVWMEDASPIKITGTEINNFSDYYVEFIANSGVSSSLQEGTWKESRIASSQNLNTFRMPCRLLVDKSVYVPNIGYKFTLSQKDGADELYGSRLVGDTDISPDPSFIGQKINNVFFHKNRLGFLSNESIILSELNQPFNFYRTAQQDLLDTDPIDITADSGTINILLNTVSYQNELIVFSKDSQFSLSSRGALTPSATSLVPISKYESDNSVTPVATARNILFSSQDNSNSTRIFEFTRFDTDVFVADDVTIHLPDYIVGTVSGIASHAASRTTVMWTRDTTLGELYVNNVLWQNNSKVQNAWHKWRLNSTALDLNQIMRCHFFDDVLTCLVRDSTTGACRIIQLDNSIALDEPKVTYRYFLDYRKLDTDLTVVPVGPNFSFVYDFCSVSKPPVVLRHDPLTGGLSEIPIISIVGTTVTTAEATDFIVGMVPECSFKPSRPVLKDQNGKTVLHLVQQLEFQSLRMYHDETSLYTVAVDGIGRNTTVDTMDAKITEVTQFNRLAVVTDVFESQIGLLFRDFSVEVKSENPFPFNIVNLEWQVTAGSIKG